MEGITLEAVDKLFQRGYDITPENMRAELDIIDMAWERFGNNIMKLVRDIPNPYESI